ncbi:hypothetical protein DFH29DRAFT_879970 [Suillus ampliporus]|nr:hypothetical protein DFH29DRAFT_879970 [Suillus ampliporus]
MNISLCSGGVQNKPGSSFFDGVIVLVSLSSQSLFGWKADTWGAMLWCDSEIFGVIKCCMSPPTLEGILANEWMDNRSLGDVICSDIVWNFFGSGGRSRQGVYGSIIMACDYDSGIATPLVEPQVDSPSGPRHTKCPNAGKGWTCLSVKEARCTGKGRQFVIPDGELENIMAPSPAKKRTHKKGQKAVKFYNAVPAVQTPYQSDGAGPAPTLHVAENGEWFRVPEELRSSGLHPLQPLGSEEHPNMTDVYDELNMVDNDKFPPSNYEMCTSPPVKFSLDRHADENEDIGHTQRHQGQAEQQVGRPGHASRKDYGQNRHEDPGEWSQPQAGHLHGASKQACSNAIVEVCTILASLSNRPKTKRAHTSNLQSNNNCQVAGDSGDMKVDTDLEVRHTSVGRRTKAAKSIQDGAIVAKRKTLGFFPDLWVKLLNYTKRPALGCILPSQTQSIVAWEAQNRRLEAGFYPQYEYDMATVIYNDSINFHSRIKQIVSNVVPVEYKLSGSESEIKQKASAFLKSSTFLHAECDKHVRNVIHVYLMYGHVNMKQTALGDSEKVYQKLTNMLKQVTNDKYHSKKLDDELRSWAVAGMTGVVVDGEPQGIESDSDWVVEFD